MLTLGAGLLAAGALLFTALNFWLSRAGQVTDRYSKAIEQLGSDKLDVRIGADISHADLAGAYLVRARLVGADLQLAKLQMAIAARADFTGANLTGANLTGANLTGANLYGANLTHVKWPAEKPVSQGWKLDTGFGQLKRAGS